MAWFNNNNKTPEVLGKEEIFEALTLKPDQLKAFAKKTGLDVRKEPDGHYMAIPHDALSSNELSAQFLDFWIGTNAEKQNIEIKRNIRNNAYTLMDEILGEAILTLDIYADEALGVGFIEHPIDINISDKKLEKDVLTILERNSIIKNSRGALRDICKWGDMGIHIILPEKGNDPLDIKMRQYTPDCWEAFTLVDSKVSVGFELKSPFQISQRRTYSKEKKILQPWEFVQFSVPDNGFAPYGRGLLEPMRIPFDNLVTIEALLALSRASRVERLIIKVPTNQTSPAAALNKLNSLKSAWKNVIFDTKSAGRKSYARTPSLQDIMFIPSDEGFSVERLAAGNGIEISATDDVEYFRDKLLMMTGLPKGILLADDSTDRYHALSQQDLKFARRLIPFQEAYAHGLTKLCMLLIGYLGGDIEQVEVTVKIKRPVQVSDTILANYEAISRTAGEMIDNYKTALENNEGIQPNTHDDTYFQLLALLGMPEDIVRLFDPRIHQKGGSITNNPDDDNITTVTSNEDTIPIKLGTMLDSTAVKATSKEVYHQNYQFFEVFKTESKSGNLLVEVLNGDRPKIVKRSRSSRNSE